MLYRIAGNFRGIQFSRKANLQSLRDLIFAEECSRVAPPPMSVRLRLLLHTRHGSNLCRKIVSAIVGENGTRVAYDRGYGPWLPRVQGDLGHVDQEV